MFLDFVSILTIFTSYVIPIILWVGYFVKEKLKNKTTKKEVVSGGVK